MQTILNGLRTDMGLLITAGTVALLVIGFIANTMVIRRTKKEYKQFMKKLGKGSNIEEMLKKYIQTVEDVSKKTDENALEEKRLKLELNKCIQKTGIVRYSAFKDTGSDLSFALCLLNNQNTGVVLNGIYSREMSNIYAKPITEGKSSYTLSNEEQQAIEIAIAAIDNKA